MTNKYIGRTLIFKKCGVMECNKVIRSHDGFCMFHRRRLRAGIPLDAKDPIRGFGAGIKNPRWSGGIAEYPKHNQMKIIRQKLITEGNQKCQICKISNVTLDIHHTDCSKTNHEKNNVMLLCRRCHCTIHKRIRALRKIALFSFIQLGLYHWCFGAKMLKERGRPRKKLFNEFF